MPSRKDPKTDGWRLRTADDLHRDNRSSESWLRDQIESLADSTLNAEEMRRALRAIASGVEWQLGTWR